MLDKIITFRERLGKRGGIFVLLLVIGVGRFFLGYLILNLLRRLMRKFAYYDCMKAKGAWVKVDDYMICYLLWLTPYSSMVSKAER